GRACSDGGAVPQLHASWDTNCAGAVVADMLRKGLVSLIGLIIVMGALIFVPAGTLDYWQAWLFLACYFAASLVVSLWLGRHDSALPHAGGGRGAVPGGRGEPR